MSSSRVRAIDTVYAGCRFRSRLEARWAVFFDALGLDWEYEPQGFEVGEPAPEDVDGEDAHGARPPVRYLPDFWLPGLGGSGLWAEVKGELRRVDLSTLCLAANPPERGGLPVAGPEDETGASPDSASPDLASPNRLRLLILTGVPRLSADERSAPVHWALTWNKGDVQAGMFMFTGATGATHPAPTWTTISGTTETVWRDDGGGLCLPFTSPLLTRISRGGEQVAAPASPQLRLLRSAYTRARSARFEFGQTPRRPSPSPARRR